MLNKQIAKIFKDMSFLFEMEEISFKPRAYQNAANSLEALAEEAAEIYKREGLVALQKIPDVGRGIAEKIEEDLKTGKIKEHEALKNNMPVDIEELRGVEGLGPKMIKIIYKKLGVKNLDELYLAAKNGKLRALPRFGEKLENNILNAAEFKIRHKKEDVLSEEAVDAEMKKMLSGVVGLKDIKGDLQLQTSWSDGANLIYEMAERAAGLNYEYIAITDHTKSLTVAQGLSGKDLLRQAEEIKSMNQKFAKENKPLKIFCGAEVNINKDGTLDIKDKVLSRLDFVGASIHSHFRLGRAEQTNRLIRVMENKNIDIIFHPTGRAVGRRAPIDIDFGEFFVAAAKTKTILEINGHPGRLDLHEEHIRAAKKFGVKFIINTDAHSAREMDFMKYGVYLARRAGLAKKDILNTFSPAEFEEIIRKSKNER